MLNKFFYILSILIMSVSLGSCRQTTLQGQPENARLGGFHEQPLDHALVRRSFDFFVSEMKRLHPEITDLKLEKAATQVIEGTRIALVCSCLRSGSSARVTGYIIEDLKGQLMFERIE